MLSNQRIGLWLAGLGFVLFLIAVLLLITGLTTVYERYGGSSTCYGYNYNTGSALVLTFIGSVITIIGLIKIARSSGDRKELRELPTA